MGGYVALWLAHEQPESVGKIITLGTKFDWSPASAQSEVKKLIPEKILEKVPAFARILEHRHAPNDWKELLEQTSALMLRLGHRPILNENVLKSIRHEVLVCLGDQDDMADARYTEQVASVMPNGKFKLLANTHHPIERVDLDTLVSILK
jgi:pimeloyl-ACP methyl ester carboxylesterase